jgi:uncharacterized protein
MSTTPRTRIRRVPKNARYDRDSVCRVLDRGRVAHVSFTADGWPYCIPTLYARAEDRVLIHGSAASRMLRHLGSGAPACVTVTILDGWVLARSAFEHSANYDSVVLFGRFRLITEPSEKLAALEAFMEAVLPGRWSEVRPPSRQELKGTAILELEIEDAQTRATVKTRTGPPDDDHTPDAERETWAGVVPITCAHGAPEPSPGLRPDVTLDASVAALLGRAAC